MSIPVAASPELANAALSCAPLARALKLAIWVGQGKALTSNEVLRPAEAAQACRALGIEFAGPRLRSALDVDELMRDWDAAVIAGFLRIEGRRAWATPDLPDASSLADRYPEAILDAWVQVAAIFLDLDEDPCAGCLAVLHALHTAAGPLTIEQLASTVLDLGDPLGDPEESSEDAAGHAPDTVFALVEFAAATLSDKAVRLTELGTFLAESVFEQRLVPPDADAATVVSAIAELPLAVAGTIARSWLNARSASGAARELLAYAESAIGVERVGAVAFATQLGPDAADAWREWAKRPGFGAYARDWLRSSGELTTEESSDEAWLAADALCIMVDSLAEELPPHLLRSVVAQRLGEDIAEVAGSVLRSGHPRAPKVLALLAGRPALAAVSGSAPAGQDQPDSSPACPPEDCGGVWRYGWLKEVLADPSHEEHQDMLEWLGLDAGEDFDPKEFSVEDVNSRLRPF